MRVASYGALRRSPRNVVPDLREDIRSSWGRWSSQGEAMNVGLRMFAFILRVNVLVVDRPSGTRPGREPRTLAYKTLCCRSGRVRLDSWVDTLPALEGCADCQELFLVVGKVGR